MTEIITTALPTQVGTHGGWLILFLAAIGPDIR